MHAAIYMGGRPLRITKPRSVNRGGTGATNAAVAHLFWQTAQNIWMRKIAFSRIARVEQATRHVRSIAGAFNTTLRKSGRRQPYAVLPSAVYPPIWGERTMSSRGRTPQA